MKSVLKGLGFIGLLCIGLWIGLHASGEVSVANEEDGWKHYLYESEFSCLLQKEKEIYAGGANGLYRIDTESGNTEEVYMGQKSLSMVRGLAEDKQGRLWIGHQNGLTILEGDASFTLGKKDGLLNAQVLDILFLDDDKTLISTFDGVGMIAEDKVESFIQEAAYLPSATIKVLYKDSRDYLWYGAFSGVGGGVSCQKEDAFQLFNIENGLVHNNITAITETPEGDILIGAGLHTKGGANRLAFKDGTWQIVETLTHLDGLAGEKVRMIYIDRFGCYWYASEYDGVAIMADDRQKLLLTVENGLTHNEVKRILEDDQGNMWLATKSGITMISESWLASHLYSTLHEEQ